MNLRGRRISTGPRAPLAILIFAAICANLSACATAVKPSPTQAPAQSWEASELIGSLNQRNQQFRAMRALARVDYAGSEGKHNFQEVVVAQRPDRLRLETLTFLGAILIVTVNDREIIAYQPREAVLLRGPRSKENLVKYTQIPLELNEITALLIGLAPVDTSAPWTQEGNALIFSPNGRKQDRVAFESQLPVPTQWERFNGAGEVELAARFSDYIQTPAGSFPSRIQIEAPRQAKRLEIRIEEPEFNGSIPAELFTQSKPANVKEYRIEAIGK